MHALHTHNHAVFARSSSVLSSESNHEHPGSQLRQWSSLIGIITAIVGNILISFALNTQRFAHIRIDREFNDGRQSSGAGKGPAKKLKGYGAAEQERRAIQRSKINAQAPGPDEQGNGVLMNGVDDDSDTPKLLQASFESADTLSNAEKDDEDDENGRKSYLQSPYWWLGIILMTIGEAGNFLAYGFAPASIVSPLGVVALISNCLIAPLMLKERFRKRDFWGVLIAIAGAVTVVLSAKNSETKLGPKDLWHNIKRWEFLVYVLITALCIAALMFASPKYGRRTILIDLGLVGLFGGYTALSTKGVASLLSGSLYKAFTFPITYFLLAVLVSSAILQIRYLNRALQTYDSTQVIPTQFVLFTLSVIIGSAVLYRDFESTTVDRSIKFIAGCLLTFFGVYLITSQRKSDDSEDAEFSAEDERIQLINEEENEVDEQTPLNVTTPQDAQEERTLRPSTPDQLIGHSRSSSKASSIPSIAVTPAESSTNLNANPWLSSTEHLDSLTKPAPRTPQISRIQLDTDSTPYFTPSTSAPLRRSPSSPADPETPTRGKRSASPPKPDLPPPSPKPTRRRSGRGSIGRLLPGPLLPPLSSSLSAVVADSLLRGEGSPRSVRALLRRNKSARNANTSSRRQSLVMDEESALQSQGVSRQPTRETLPPPSPGIRDIIEGEDDLPSKKGRLRAVSESLGGMISGKRKGKKKEDNADGVGGGGGSSTNESSQ